MSKEHSFIFGRFMYESSREEETNDEHLRSFTHEQPEPQTLSPTNRRTPDDPNAALIPEVSEEDLSRVIPSEEKLKSFKWLASVVVPFIAGLIASALMYFILH